MKLRSRVHRISVAASIVLAVGFLSTLGVPAEVATGAGVGGHATTSSPSGYWLVAADGGVFSYGDGAFHGSTGSLTLNQPIVGMATTPSSNGYWLVASDGGVFAFGDAGFFGSMGGQHLNAPIVGMATTAVGQGYWLVAFDGGIFSFGDAGFRGSMGGTHLNEPVVGMAATGTSNGYWLVASDGGVFSFGDATFYGSMGGQPLNKPVVGMAALPSGDGYWLVASDGGIFSFGATTFYGSTGSLTLNKPVVGMAGTPDGTGYWLVAADGGIFSYGSATFQGSTGSIQLNRPVVGMASIGHTVGGRVLLVGTFSGHPGQYSSIQAAVDAARPGDWILIAPGDYHEDDDMVHPPSASDIADGWYGGVDITTSNIHLRGMNRNSVIVDGTNATASTPCSSAPADQNFGYVGADGAAGRNGILVWKADNVSIENLTACNFLSGNGNAGNEIWWDGAPSETGPLGITGYTGNYLTATSTYYDPSDTTTAAGYGIFSSAAAGPGVWSQIYGSNFNDSGMYVGACRQLCDAWIHNAWMEYDPLGYSGTDSGGTLVVSQSQFDNNQDGFDTNTQIASDPPPPQNGACPDGGVSGITHTTSCWVFLDNNVHDNNNPSVPKQGEAAVGPVGTGMTVSGGRDDTVMDNTFTHNGGWGALFVPFPDTDTPPAGVTCAGAGGTDFSSLGFGCVFDAQSDALVDNTFSQNGFFGNPTNGDYGQITLTGGHPQNCFSGNVAPDGSTPSDLETTQATCGPNTTGANTGGALFNEVLCASNLAGPGFCSPTDSYPQAGTVTLKPLPSNLPTMPNPCVGVPDNAWCSGGEPVRPNPG
ncbi:MAG: hypothetical protein ACLP2J_13750 [Acidimicrobiales bacterium]